MNEFFVDLFHLLLKDIYMRDGTKKKKKKKTRRISK